MNDGAFSGFDVMSSATRTDILFSLIDEVSTSPAAVLVPFVIIYASTCKTRSSIILVFVSIHACHDCTKDFARARQGFSSSSGLLGADSDDRSIKRSCLRPITAASDSCSLDPFITNPPVVYYLAADLLPEAAAASGLARTNLGRQAATLGQYGPCSLVSALDWTPR